MQVFVKTKEGGTVEVSGKCAGCNKLLTPGGGLIGPEELSSEHGLDPQNPDYNHNPELRVLPWTNCRDCHPASKQQLVGA